jgi:hypothetical protein
LSRQIETYKNPSSGFFGARFGAQVWSHDGKRVPVPTRALESARRPFVTRNAELLSLLAPKFE